MPGTAPSDAPVLVTGSSGRIGTAVSEAMAARGIRVRGLDVTAGPWTSRCGDVRDPATCRRMLSGARAVVHTAALHAPHLGRHADGDFIAVNEEGTQHLLDAAVAEGVTRFVLTSSTSVYGEALEPERAAVWVSEQLPPRPRDIYDRTKLAAEAAVQGAGLSSVVLRIARCFPQERAVALIHGLHRSVLIEDVARAHVRALEADVESSLLFNIAGDYPFHPEDVGDLLEDADDVLTRRHPLLAERLTAAGVRLSGGLDRVYDSSAARRTLGYRPASPTARLLSLPTPSLD
jgi:UDP-glucose 4-epimerase